MNDLCYECSQGGAKIVWIVWIVFLFIKKLGALCTNKTEIKDGLQYTNKELSLPADVIIYAPEEDLEMK